MFFAISGSVLLLGLAVVLFLLLVPSCGANLIGFRWSFGGCAFASVQPSIQAQATRDRSALVAEINGLERDLLQLQCQAEMAKDIVLPDEKPFENSSAPELASQADCASDEQAARASETVFVMDTSSSMGFSIDTPAQLERDLQRVIDEVESIEQHTGGFNLQAVLSLPSLNAQWQRLQKQLENYPGTERIEIARKVTAAAISDAPDDMPVGLVTFDKCDVRRHGTFAPDDRSRLVRTISGMREKDSTPLARSVIAAAQTLSGGDDVDDPVNIVVLSDGFDSCGGDPCAAARQAKSSKPGLVINVVDLSNSGAIACMAEVSGGFYQPYEKGMDVDDLTRVLKEAAGYEGAGLCRK